MSIAVAVFAVSLGYILYILAGYPALLYLAARWRPRPVRRDPSYLPGVSVILPVRNGRRWIAAKLANLLSELDYPADRIEVIVVSDGSDDGTDEFVSASGDSRVRFARIERGGKAAALNRGIELAQSEILFLTDVRQPLDKDCLRNLTACFADPEVGAVSGELIILSGDTHEQQHVGLYWRYEKLIRKSLSAVASVFGATGAVYAIRRGLVRPLPPYTLDDDVYLPLCAHFAGHRVVFEDSAVAYDYPAPLDAEYQRKVRTLAGVYQVIGFFPALLWPGTRGWVHFVSHKFGRMMLPWALAAAVISSWWLPGPLRALAIAAEALLAFLVLIDPVVGEASALKRLTSVSRTFLVLMLATAAAISIFFRPASSFWKETRPL